MKLCINIKQEYEFALMNNALKESNDILNVYSKYKYYDLILFNLYIKFQVITSITLFLMKFL